MSDLVEWLTKVLDEDERAAKAVPEPREWHVGDESDAWAGWDRDMVYCWPPEFHTPYEQDKHWRGMQLPHAETASFVAMNSPAAVLADIAAKRAIVEVLAWERKRQRVATDHMVIRVLATAYADRPGYRDEWWPQEWKPRAS